MRRSFVAATAAVFTTLLSDNAAAQSDRCVTTSAADGMLGATAIPQLLCIPRAKLLSPTVTQTNATAASTMQDARHPAQTVLRYDLSDVAPRDLLVGQSVNDGGNWPLSTSPSSRIPARLPAGWVNATSAGLKCDGSTDDTAALNAEIAAMPNGGNILFPAATCIFAGSISVNQPGIHLVCAGPTGSGGTGTPVGTTTLYFTGAGTGNLVMLGSQSTVSQVYNLGVHNCTISAPKRTGGYVFYDYGTSQTMINNIQVAGAWNLLYGNNFNNLYLQNVNAWLNATSGYNVHVYNLITGRSDVLAMDNVVWNSQSKGADGFLADGMIQTARLHHVAILNCGTGLTTLNTQESSDKYPQYFFIDDLEIDGCGVGGAPHNPKYGINLAAGSDFHIINSDIDLTAAQTSCTSCRPFSSSPDLGHSKTREIYIASTALHSSPMGAAYINASRVSLVGDHLGGLCNSSSGCDSAIVVASDADGIIITGSILNADGQGGNSVINGISVNSGATNVALSNNNYRGATAGNVRNNSNSVISLVGGIGYDGAPITVTSCAAGMIC